jgi:hypothetical protein
MLKYYLDELRLQRVNILPASTEDLRPCILQSQRVPQFTILVACNLVSR